MPFALDQVKCVFVLVALGLSAPIEAQLFPPGDDLVAWFSADSGVTNDENGVNGWEDLAGGLHNATRHAPYGPGYPEISCGQFPSGEHAVVNFTGDTGMALENPDDLNQPETSIYVVAESRPESAAQGSVLCNYSSFVNWGFGYQLRFDNGETPMWFTSSGTEATYGNHWAGADANVPMSPGYHYVTATFSNQMGTKQLYVDGNLSSIDFTGMEMTYHDEGRQAIGCQREFGVMWGSDTFFVGGIAEILIYRSVNELQRKDVEEYLFDKYFDPAGQATPTPVRPTGLECAVNVAGTRVDLNWKVCGTYQSQTVLRDGSELASVAADATSYVDEVPLEGVHTYTIEAVLSGIKESTTCELEVVVPQAQGRILHLAADQGVTTTENGVTLWEDLSPVGGDNSAFRQADYGSSFPQVGCASLPTGVHNVIEFDGDTGFEVLNPEALNAVEISIYAVFQVSAQSGSILNNYTDPVNWGFGYLLRMAGAGTKGNHPVFFTTAGTQGTIHDAHSPTELADGYYLITATMSSVNEEKFLYVNGEVDMEFSQENPGEGHLNINGRILQFHPTQRVGIGTLREFDNDGHHLTNQQHVGGIAEIIVYDSVSDEQRQMVEAELLEKYFDGTPPAFQTFRPFRLSCHRSPAATEVFLEWENCQTYEGLGVFRNGVFLENIPEDSNSYVDNSPPIGDATYEIVAEFGDGSTGGPSCQSKDPRTAGCRPNPADPRLVLWLEADKGVTTDASGVVTWEDQAGGDNNAFTRAEGLTDEPWYGDGQPQLDTATMPGGDFPVLFFDEDAGMEIENGADLNLGELSIFVVAEIGFSSGSLLVNYSNSVIWGYGWDLRSLAKPEDEQKVLGLFTSAGTCGSYSPREAPNAVSLAGGYKVISAKISNASGEKALYVDGEQVRSWQMGNSNSARCEDETPFVAEVGYDEGATERTGIGSFREFDFGLQNTGRHHGGGIAEILVVNSADSDLHTDIDLYLTKKYVTGNRPTECPDPAPFGACCNNGNCDVRTQTDCESAGGTYNGDDTTCGEGGIVCPAAGTDFRRGDCDQSGKVDFNDAIFHLRFLFLGENEDTVNGCKDACDSDDSGADDFTDDINTLRFLFLGQGEVPSPGPMPDESHPCGVDPTEESPEELTCEEYAPAIACP